MSETVVAFARRDRVVLAVPVRGDAAADLLGRVEVVAEDGARFALPADQIFARFPTALAGHTGGTVAERLVRLRKAVERPVAWSDLHRRLATDRPATFEDIAAAAEATDEAGRLRVALAMGASHPWVRRDGIVFVVTPREEAVAKIHAAESLRRAEREDEHLRVWWPKRKSEPVPTHAGGAVEALRAYAFFGDVPATERGRLLAARLEIADPDQLLEALVESGLLPGDANPAASRAGLAAPYGEDVEAEVARVLAEPIGADGREDLTELHTVSVDDDETVEVDDALSVRRTADGVELFVHISDAAASVPIGGALDAAARARTSSLYLPDGPVPMLPADLVAGRASLDVGVVRPAVTGIFTIGPDGAVVSSRFVRSLVRVTRRVSYDATADVSTLAATADDAAALVAAARARREARIRGGAVVTSLPSLKIRVEAGEPHVERRSQDTAGDLVVAEAAVLYNAEAGRLFASRDVAAFFRAQEAPRGPAPDAESPMYAVLVRRRFAPTQIRVEPARHHGVGADAYAQATSPIRRFADLVNQRQLVAIIEARTPPYRPGDLESLTNHVAERERAIRRASGAREDHWFARWLVARGVREVEGVLVRVPRRGLGGVWSDEYLCELPLRAPDRWKAPPEGTRAVWRVERILPWRGRIDLVPMS